MKKSLILSLGIMVIVLLSIFPISLAKGSNNNRTTFYGSIYEQTQAIEDYYLHQDSKALKKDRNEAVIETKTNSLFASTLFHEYSNGGSIKLQNIAQSIVRASTQYFDEAYTSDNAGWVSMYDFYKAENSYVKSRKFTHDQVLMMLSLALSYSNLASDDEFKSDYAEGITETQGFIERNLQETESGWVDSLFTVNRTSYTKNHFRIIENICWTIWAILSLPDSIDSPFSLTEITQIMNLIHTNGTYNGAVFNVLSPDWDSSDDVLKLRTNALYGIINLMLYEITSNTNFLDRGKAIFDFIRSNMYDRGFGGFFDVVDKNGMLVVQRKSTTGNALACLLSSKLCKFYPTNETIKTTLVRTNRFIEENLLNENSGLYYITCERSGSPLIQHSLQTDTIRLWQRVNSLHIINGSISSEISIGDKIEIDLYLNNKENLNYSIFINGDEVESYNQTSTDSHLSLLLNLKSNAEIGYSDIDITIKVLSGTIDQDSVQIRIGSDRRLPQGLVYLIALGLLAGIVVVVRYPPKNIGEILTRLSTISAVEEEADTQTEEDQAQDKERKIPQSED